MFDEPALKATPNDATPNNAKANDASPNNAKPLAQSEGPHTLLLAQLEQACAQQDVTGDLGFVSWMRAPATLDLVRIWLVEMHISPDHARVLLALLYMAHDADEVFDAGDRKSVV